MDMTGKKFVFAMNILKPKETVWLCVEKCPEEYIESELKLQIYSNRTSSHFCFYDIPYDYYSEIHGTVIGPCPVLPVFDSEPILRRCIPKLVEHLTSESAHNIVLFLNSFNTVQLVFSDLCTCYKEILFMFGISCAMLGLFWYWYFDVSSLEKMSIQQMFRNLTLTFDEENNKILLGCSIIVTIAVGFFIIVCFCVICKNMQLVVELFQQAHLCIKNMPILIFQPLWTFLALLAFVIYWFFVVLLIITATDAKLSSLSNIKRTNITINIAEYSIAMPVKYVLWYHFIGLIWVSEFIYACQQMVISCSVTIWYFSKDKDNLNCAVLKSTQRLIRYHLGSVAFGSFIITCVKVPRMVLMYLKKQSETTESLFVKYALSACICCLYCVEKCLKYIHQNAYTIIAIEGRSFCPSAVKACTILLKNALQMATVSLLGKFVLFVAKCSVTVVVGLISAIWFRHIGHVHYWFVPVIVVCIFAFFVSDCFFSVYEMVIDTLFICHCEYKSITVEKEDVRMDGNVPDVTAVDPNMIKFLDKISIDKQKQSKENDDNESKETEERVTLMD